MWVLRSMGVSRPKQAAMKLSLTVQERQSSHPLYRDNCEKCPGRYYLCGNCDWGFLWCSFRKDAIQESEPLRNRVKNIGNQGSLGWNVPLERSVYATVTSTNWPPRLGILIPFLASQTLHDPYRSGLIDLWPNC